MNIADNLYTFAPIAFGYFLGSVPFGVIAGMIMHVNLRKVGSGNIGATNVYRSMGIMPAILVFAADLLKGTLAVLFAKYVFMPAEPLYFSRDAIIVMAGIAAVLGHMYSFILVFKGGKGAATSLGVLLAIAPDLFLIAIIFVALSIYVTKYVSLTTILSVILLSVLMFAFNKPMEYSIATLVIAVFVIYQHIPNIRRLISGKEPKIWGSTLPKTGPVK
jgi:acyl phosphate:glycerol-3-phosphate acyltransferase